MDYKKKRSETIFVLNENLSRCKSILIVNNFSKTKFPTKEIFYFPRNFIIDGPPRSPTERYVGSTGQKNLSSGPILDAGPPDEEWDPRSPHAWVRLGSWDPSVSLRSTPPFNLFPLTRAELHERYPGPATWAFK